MSFGRMARTLTLSAIAVFFSLLLPARMVCAADSWYKDLVGHWAWQYVRVLWDEGVTDGYVDNDGKAYYMPEDDTTRAELAVMLCKVFALPPTSPAAPSFPDVPRSYRLFPGKPAWAWIEGAAAGGLALVPQGEEFNPDASITREDTVELMVRSLDLLTWAQTLTEEEIEQILEPFHDHGRVSQERRASMACAVQVGIIKGYEDHTIRPGSHIARGETATVTARSCLIRMSARSPSFSPDGDGVDDTIAFDVGYLRNRGVSQWQAAIQDQSGDTVFLFNVDDVAGEPPATLSWDGSDLHDRIVPAGQYYYQAWVWDHEGRQFSSLKRPIAVEAYLLSAYLSPTAFKDGDRLSVVANTEPAAQSVTVSFEDGKPMELKASHHSTRWTLSLTAGPSIPYGAHTARVEAVFDKARKQVDLDYSKTEDIWISGTADPNPASWAQDVTLRSSAAQAVAAVNAACFGTSIGLRRDGSLWTGVITVPWGIAAGFYTVSFTGYTGHSEVTAAISLEITGPRTQNLTYFLAR